MERQAMRHTHILLVLCLPSRLAMDGSPRLGRTAAIDDMDVQVDRRKALLQEEVGGPGGWVEHVCTTARQQTSAQAS